MKCWKIKKLQTQNFRNLKDCVFNFSPGINCILGKNGNGKTNLLEALFYLTNKKSFRKNTDYSQMVNIEGENPEIIIKSVFENENELHSHSLRNSPTAEERFLNNKLEKSKLPSSSVFVNPFEFTENIGLPYKSPTLSISPVKPVGPVADTKVNVFPSNVKFASALAALDDPSDVNILLSP